MFASPCCGTVERMRSRLAASVVALSLVAVLIAACGGNSSGSKKSASDKTTGLTVTVSDDQVSLARTARSTSGTGGSSGTVSCTDDYAKLARATGVPAPSQPWYATTYITWPATGKSTSARLSHSLRGDPQLCVVQSGDQSASALIYFDAKAKAGVEKLQTDGAKSQQAAQATQALQSAAQAAVGAVSNRAFPTTGTTLVAAITSSGLYSKSVASESDVTETGTIYVVTGKTTRSSLELALKDSRGVVHTATEGVRGSPKLATVRG
jgi:hypothetical protein